LTNQISLIKIDLEESKQSSSSFSESEKKYRQEIENWKAQFTDMQRCERTLRIDLDEAKRSVIKKNT
jgi:hypothetical protein